MQEPKQSVVSDTKLAHAVGGKSARACDNCVRKRARWYCAADDAFLCDACDSSVHSANPLARRHERVRLKISNGDATAGVPPPSWHEGFTKKARTPRGQKKKKNGNFISNIIPQHLVLEQENCSEEECEEQLLYRVPVFDFENYGENNTLRCAKVEMNDLEGIIPSESEFAADVESLLGKGLEDEAYDMEGLGIIFDCDDHDEASCLRIKAEDEEFGEKNHDFLQIDLGRETFELNFDYASPINTCGEDEEDNKTGIREKDDSGKALLKLDYDRVMSAWDHKKSPWTSGERPELSSGDWWPDCCTLGTSWTMHAYGGMAMKSGGGAGGDGGREARVSRYREKRRTRLFSKKIRYEVRKLNAEKRPRMKGRFVKRESFAASAFPLLNK
ncbi:zinc finger protein CONSTANS-LIKE 16-like [Salvia divinorum]|uniref:Zinc finger protein CONSTANS-LIKE 16-like n=1 Tax=Salvia divinorum TaxID=28513 RepID=A0ABD1IIX8_SALDI